MFARKTQSPKLTLKGFTLGALSRLSRTLMLDKTINRINCKFMKEFRLPNFLCNIVIFFLKIPFPGNEDLQCF